jgi:hypothetical protein
MIRRAMIRSTAMVLPLLLFGACFSEVDVDLASDDWRANFTRLDPIAGEAPGHGDSVRDIYVNDVGRRFTGVGLYPVGTIVVKEIYRRNDDDTAGAFRYIGIMRKLEEAPDGGELDDGWLFTYRGELDGPETHRPRCWRTCHQNAPFDGTFLNLSASAD